MPNLIASMNITLDGYCDHTVMTADEELHQHYTDMLNNAGAILYGRVTYQLMEDFWPTIVAKPTGQKDMDDFAMAIHNVPKILFSHTVKSVSWENTKLATRSLEEEVRALKQQPGKDIFVGSPGLIASLTRLKLIDQYHLCIHPVIAGGGLPLSRDINERSVLKLVDSKTFGAGVVAVYYEVEGK